MSKAAQSCSGLRRCEFVCEFVCEPWGLGSSSPIRGRHYVEHHTTPHRTAPHHNTPYCTAPHNTTPHHTTPYHTLTTPHHTTPHRTTHSHVSSAASRSGSPKALSSVQLSSFCCKSQIEDHSGNRCGLICGQALSGEPGVGFHQSRQRREGRCGGLQRLGYYTPLLLHSKTLSSTDVPGKMGSVKKRKKKRIGL